MKAISHVYLTGKPKVDKYLIQGAELLNKLRHEGDRHYYPIWYEVLDQELNKEEFQNLLDNRYPEGFEETLRNYYLDNIEPLSLEQAFKMDYHMTFDTVYYFAKILAKNDTWAHDILCFIEDYKPYLLKEHIKIMLDLVKPTKTTEEIYENHQ